MMATRRPGIPTSALVAGYVALVLLPLVLARLQELPSRGTLTEFSSGLAMAGLVMLLGQFLTSGRFELTTERAGIDLTLRGHQLIARFLGGLLVAHPLLYALPAARSGADAAVRATTDLFLDPRLLSGVAAWVLLIVLMLASLLRDRLRLRYELWRVTHGVGALLIAGLGAYHAVSVGRYTRADAVLAGFWLVLVAAAVLSLLYVYVFVPLVQLGRPWRVASVRSVGDRLWEVVLEPAAVFVQRLTAGQFFWLTLDRSPFSITEHPFSVTSSAAELPRLSFLIKESGDATNRIGALPIGAVAYVHGPRGNFTLAGRDGAGICLIAGGVGFAPILGILRQLHADGDPRPIRLLVGNRHAGQIVYGEEIAAMASRLDLVVRNVVAEPPSGWTEGIGVITAREVTALLPADERSQWLYFVCGPPAMMDAIERILLDLGVPARAIVSERFRYD